MREYIHHQIVNTFFSDDNYKPYNTEERFIATLKYPSGYGLHETKIKIVNQTTTANEVISKALRKLPNIDTERVKVENYVLKVIKKKHGFFFLHSITAV